MYAKGNIDARTFPEIWNTLSKAEQSELRYEIVKSGDASRTTIYNWSKGLCPVSLGIRRRVAQKMSKVLGLNVSHLTLFPLK